VIDISLASFDATRHNIATFSDGELRSAGKTGRTQNTNETFRVRECRAVKDQDWIEKYLGEEAARRFFGSPMVRALLPVTITPEEEDAINGWKAAAQGIDFVGVLPHLPAPEPLMKQLGWFMGEARHLVNHLRRSEPVSLRKLRLCGVACCNRLSEFITDERSVQLLAGVERFADGEIPESELRPLIRGAERARNGHPRRPEYSWDSNLVDEAAADPNLTFHLGEARYAAAETVLMLTSDDWQALLSVPTELLEAVRQAKDAVEDSPVERESAEQAKLLRDILGNPFRPRPIDEKWNREHSHAVRPIARRIYDDRAFDGLPILADAMQERGFADEAMLAHLRSEQQHVRGCWVLDLILGKE